MKPDKIYDALKDIMKDYFPEPLDISSYDQTYLNELGKNENSIKIVLDRVNLKVLNVSDNVEDITGHSYEDWMKDDYLFTFSTFMSENHNFLLSWMESAALVYEKANGNLLNYKSAFCGMKFNHKLGYTLRSIWRYSPIEIFENTLHKTAIISIDNVTHLMKGNAYWGRTSFGEPDKPQYHHFHSKENLHVFQDIISDREKEVLKLIAKGWDSKEIGESLFISSNTVNNHRRNMITRIGARDSTALVQLCRMCGII